VVPGDENVSAAAVEHAEAGTHPFGIEREVSQMVDDVSGAVRFAECLHHHRVHVVGVTKGPATISDDVRVPEMRIGG